MALGEHGVDLCRHVGVGAQQIGRNATGVQGDAGNLDDLDRLFRTVKSEKGRIDVLFANAGIGAWAEPLAAVTESSFDDVFGVNVRGTLFAVQKAVPLMTDGGSIILNGSQAATKGFPGTTVYSASKAALRAFARTWTAELKDQKIRVNVVQPGSIDTASLAPLPPEVRDSLRAAIPLGRFGEADEIATAALFLASADSSYVSGLLHLYLAAAVASGVPSLLSETVRDLG
jgi:NAD(P)-dependent dehydrogenase (short-subunit alcohol dehydrogenase family)